MREYTAGERKLLKISASPWFTWGMALVFGLFVLNDYRRHQLTWIDWLPLGVWSVLSIIELAAIISFPRTKKNIKPE